LLIGFSGWAGLGMAMPGKEGRGKVFLSDLNKNLRGLAGPGAAGNGGAGLGLAGLGAARHGKARQAFSFRI